MRGFLKYSLSLMLITLLTVLVSCNQGLRKLNTPSEMSNRIYSVLDSVYFHMPKFGNPTGGSKMYDIALSKLDSNMYEAHFDCAVEYYLKCACKPMMNNSALSFRVKYSKEVKQLGNDNSAIRIEDLTEVKSKLELIAKDTLSSNVCKSAINEAKSLLHNESNLSGKLKYELVHIHKYEDTILPENTIAINHNIYEDINFDYVTLVENISDAIYINEYGKHELNVWRTVNLSNDIIELSLLNVSENDSSTLKSIEEIGGLFVAKDLKVEAISNLHIESKVYKIDIKKNILVEYTLKMKTESKDMTQHIYRSVKLK